MIPCVPDGVSSHHAFERERVHIKDFPPSSHEN